MEPEVCKSALIFLPICIISLTVLLIIWAAFWIIYYYKFKYIKLHSTQASIRMSITSLECSTITTIIGDKSINYSASLENFNMSQSRELLSMSTSTSERGISQIAEKEIYMQSSMPTLIQVESANLIKRTHSSIDNYKNQKTNRKKNNDNNFSQSDANLVETEFISQNIENSVSLDNTTLNTLNPLFSQVSPTHK